MSQTPPPPPPPSVPPPPPPRAAMPPPPPVGPGQAAAPPRPKAPTAAGLMIGGAVVMAIGSFLTWITIGGEDVNGFTELAGESSDGPAFVGLGVILAGFGITTLAARRLLPIAILAVVFASFALLAALVDYGDVVDAEDRNPLVEAGAGLPIVIVGTLIALAGGIVALAKRRR